MRTVSITVMAILFLGLHFINAQNIITHEYRRVAPADMQEYIERETTYWKVFAENEIKKGNLTFWGIFERIDGMNLDTGANILIINSFNDMDKGVDWASVTDLFPGVAMDKMNTWGMSTTTDRIFIRNSANHIRKPNAVPENDYRYVRFIYHNVKNLTAHLSFESEKWMPLVERAWNEGKSTMTGWGNGTIILPQSENFYYNSYSYDIFPSLQAALNPAFSNDLSIPDGFWNPLQDNYNDNGRTSQLYRVVAAVQAPPQ